MGEVKLLIQVEGDKVYVTPLGIPFHVKREAFEKLMDATGDNTYVRDVSVKTYNDLAALASYGR